MNKDNEIELEAFIDEQGRLLVRCKESKRMIAGLQSVSLSNSVKERNVRYISIEVMNINDEA